jgi:hypothetical protein
MKTMITMALFAALVLAGGCEKKNVPLGGECKYDEDCDKNGVACLIAEGAETGYCTKPCQLSTGGLNDATEQQCPESMACERAAQEHFVLGASFCVKQ